MVLFLREVDNINSITLCRYSLISLREHIKKRPPLATTEKVQQLVKVSHIIYGVRVRISASNLCCFMT